MTSRMNIPTCFLVGDGVNDWLAGIYNRIEFSITG